MEVKFLGASEEVTGSCYYLKNEEVSFLVDCGQFQGLEETEKKNEDEFPFDAKDIDFVVLTHAHIDHCGRLPLLVKRGFHGKIYCTHGTKALCELLLLDSAKIHEIKAENENEEREQAGLDLIEPLYTTDDAINTLQYLYPLEYDETTTFNKIEIKFKNSCHLLGAGSAYISVNNKTILFSGDIGSKNSQLLQPPEPAQQADYIFMESTYGNRLHKDADIRLEKLRDVIVSAIKDNHTVIIPAFAVGRTQEVIYGLRSLNDEEINNIKFFADSPMGIKATEIFKKNFDNYKLEIKKKLLVKEDIFSLKNLTFVDSPKGSYGLNFIKEPKVIISSSGMCNGGRILDHLIHYLEKPDTTIIFVGYQAEKTIGRFIQTNMEEIKIYDSVVKNNAKKVILDGFSGHGDRNELINWVKNTKPKKLFIVHGEKESMESLSETLKNDYGFDTHIPELYSSYTLDI